MVQTLKSQINITPLYVNTQWTCRIHISTSHTAKFEIHTYRKWAQYFLPLCFYSSLLLSIPDVSSCIESLTHYTTNILGTVHQRYFLMHVSWELVLLQITVSCVLTDLFSLHPVGVKVSLQVANLLQQNPFPNSLW